VLIALSEVLTEALDHPLLMDDKDGILAATKSRSS